MSLPEHLSRRGIEEAFGDYDYNAVVPKEGPTVDDSIHFKREIQLRQSEQSTNPRTSHVYDKCISGRRLDNDSDVRASFPHYENTVNESVKSSNDQGGMYETFPDITLSRGYNDDINKRPNLCNEDYESVVGNGMDTLVGNTTCEPMGDLLVDDLGNMSVQKDRLIETSPPLLTTGQVECEAKAVGGPCDSVDIRHTYFSAKDLFGNGEKHEMGDEYVVPIDMSASSGYSLASENVSIPDKEQKANVDDNGYLIAEETNL